MQLYGETKKCGYNIAGHGHDFCSICKPPSHKKVARRKARENAKQEIREQLDALRVRED